MSGIATFGGTDGHIELSVVQQRVVFPSGGHQRSVYAAFIIAHSNLDLQPRPTQAMLWRCLGIQGLKFSVLGTDFSTEESICHL